MAITSGTYNVGPAETLTSMTAIAAEINGQTFVGDVTFIQTGSITQGSGAAHNFANINMGGFTLKFKGATVLMDPSSGYRWRLPGMAFLSTVINGILEFEDINFNNLNAFRLLSVVAPITVRHCRSIFNAVSAGESATFLSHAALIFQSSNTKYQSSGNGPALDAGATGTQIASATIENACGYQSAFDAGISVDAAAGYIRNSAGFGSFGAPGIVIATIPESNNAGNNGSVISGPYGSVVLNDSLVGPGINPPNDPPFGMDTLSTSPLYIAGTTPLLACNPYAGPVYPIGTVGNYAPPGAGNVSNFLPVMGAG